MDPVWLLLLLPLAAASGWYAGTRSNRPPRAIRSDIPQAYLKSLNLLLNEQQDKALDVLISALETHEETVEIQLALGNLFRRIGELERATQLLQNLIGITRLPIRCQTHQFIFTRIYLESTIISKCGVQQSQ